MNRKIDGVRFTSIITLAVAAIISCRPAARTTSTAATAAANDTRGPSVWAVDVVTVRPGERENYRRFLEANWAKARRTLRERGEIRSYHAAFSPDAGGANAQVLLLTEYPDSTAYARREEIFQPVLAAQGRTLIDGKATRELTERLVSTSYVAFLGQR